MAGRMVQQITAQVWGAILPGWCMPGLPAVAVEAWRGFCSGTLDLQQVHQIARADANRGDGVLIAARQLSLHQSAKVLCPVLRIPARAELTLPFRDSLSAAASGLSPWVSCCMISSFKSPRVQPLGTSSLVVLPSGDLTLRRGIMVVRSQGRFLDLSSVNSHPQRSQHPRCLAKSNVEALQLRGSA